MANEDDEKDGQEEEGLEFEMIEPTKQPKPGPALDTEGGTLHPTGLLPLNKLGSGLWINLVKDRGLEPEKAACKYGVNKEKGIVSAYPVNPMAVKKPTPFRLTGARKDRVSLHIGPVFDLVNDLRPAGKRSVVVSRVKDKNGTPCLAIYLTIAQTKRSNRRAAAKPGPEAEAAPSADETGAEEETEE